MDSQLELSLEVMDDFMREAEEVDAENQWLKYSLYLHRMREMGSNHRLLDLLDERKFTLDELRELLVLRFRQDRVDGLPWSGLGCWRPQT